MTRRLEEATKAYRRAEAMLSKRRRELADAIVDEYTDRAPGLRQSDIVEITGYTREHVRRILRAAGR